MMMFKLWFNDLIGINWKYGDSSNHTTLYVFHFLRGTLSSEERSIGRFKQNLDSKGDNMKATFYKKAITEYEESVTYFITEVNKDQVMAGVKLLNELLRDFTTVEVCLDIMDGSGNSFAKQILTKLRKVEGEES
jgi:hypothetical protein